MPTDKSIESAHFKSFRFFAGESVPEGAVTHVGTFGERAPDGAPDFLIGSTERILGIELRELLKQDDPAEHSERAEEECIDDLLKISQELAELRGMPRARVSLMVDHGVPRKRAERLALGHKLAGLVSKHMPGDGGHADLDWNLMRAEGIHCVSRIMIHRDDRLHRSGIWVAPQAGRVLADCAELLQKAIDSKARKYPTYRKYCHECWLVLVADSFRPSATIHPSERSLAHRYNSPFERTYFLDYGLGKLHLLSTDHSDS